MRLYILVNCIERFKTCVYCSNHHTMPFYNVILIINILTFFFFIHISNSMRRGSVHLDTIKKKKKKHLPKPLSKMFKENQVYYITRIKSGRAPIVFDMLIVFFYRHRICCNLRRSCV